MAKEVLYDGSLMCHTANCCPVVTVDKDSGVVEIHDPHKPEDGKFRTSIENWNKMIRSTPIVV